MKHTYEIWGGIRKMIPVSKDSILLKPVGNPIAYKKYWTFEDTEKGAVKKFNDYYNDCLILIDRTNNKIIKEKNI